MKQPEALYLADILEDAGKPADVAEKAALELRRLHAKCEALTEDTIEEMRRITELHRVTAQRDALLEALKRVTTAPDLSSYGAALHDARAAIAKAEENT